MSELELLGCRRDILLRCVYCVLNAEKTTFPSRREVLSLCSTLRRAANKIKAYEEIGVTSALRIDFRPSPTLWGDQFLSMERERIRIPLDIRKLEESTPFTLAKLADWYAELLENWLTPRKDLVKSCARAMCCLYPKVAKKQSKFSGESDHMQHVTTLLDSFERGTTKGDLKKNLRNFMERSPLLYFALTGCGKMDSAT
jgi:hypothetical protein